MKRDQVDAIIDVQVGIGQLGTLLSIMADGVDDYRAKDAIECCAARASDIARQVDCIPGFVSAQASPRGAPAIRDRHVQWLENRKVALARASGLDDGSAEHDQACASVNELDHRIMATLASCRTEMMAKLTLLAIVNAEGASPAPEEAARIAAEAESFLAGEA